MNGERVSPEKLAHALLSVPVVPKKPKGRRRRFELACSSGRVFSIYAVKWIHAVDSLRLCEPRESITEVKRVDLDLRVNYHDERRAPGA